MKIILKEIVGDNDPDYRSRLLSFKEFCQYVYEPSKRIKTLNLPEEERQLLEQTIAERLRPQDL